MKQSLSALFVAILGIFCLLIYKTAPKTIHTTHYTTPQIKNENLKQSIARTPPTQVITHVMETSSSQELKNQLILSDFKNKMLDLKKCLKTMDCQYPQTDPRSYEMGVYGDVLENLQALYNWSSRHKIKNKQILDLTIPFLSFHWSDIKIEVLKIILQQDPQSQTVDPILKHVIRHSQPDAMNLALQELARHTDDISQSKINREVQFVLKRGSVFAAQEIAKNIHPIIHSGNRNEYKKIASELEHTPLSQDIAQRLYESLSR